MVVANAKRYSLLITHYSSLTRGDFVTTLATGAKQRLLIVDDQSANVRVIAEALRDQYELFFATSGAKALEILATNDIELVLLDVVMPEMDGFEVCRRMKSDARTSRIPVIFVTAREEASDETRGFDVGGVDYITKPIHPAIVGARVRTHLELKRARDLLERLASIDGLTGIANRRQFDLFLEQEWKRATRTGGWFSLALVDVDEFKKYNDTFGHARGDDCLRAIARALLTVARRPSDLAARYGGEEFAVVLPDTDPAAMPLVIGSMLEAVRSLGLVGCDGGTVTISAGAISVIPDRDAPASSAIESADRLLYEAKRGGRNHAMHADLATGIRHRIDSVALRETAV
jgi:diguanylate cyclase (GGDEF)-like protein